MPPRISHQIAVLGSGIGGSTAARKLAESGMKVTVFECGVGVGGRTSTRITRDEHRFAFDHGAQYISQAKSQPFALALAEWESAGFLKEWKGRVANATSLSVTNDGASNIIYKDAGSKIRYVGYPAMNSICTNLLDHENIEIVTQTRACATYNDIIGRWLLTSHGDRRELGQFEWLVAGDRLSATNNRADLRNAPLSDFKNEVEQIASVPILVLMVALESPLDEIPFDGITFDEESGEFGSLGWLARDTSKPGRGRKDGAECWVVQSGPKAAKRILDSTVDEVNFEKRRELVREMTKETLLKDFMATIPKLSTSSEPIPRVLSAVGHRWSAAFPSVPKSSDGEQDYSANIDHKFVACGDYLGKLTGRIEGAYISGASAAAALLDAQAKDEP